MSAQHLLYFTSGGDGAVFLQPNANVADLVLELSNEFQLTCNEILSVCRMKPPVPRAKSVSVSVDLSAQSYCFHVLNSLKVRLSR